MYLTLYKKNTTHSTTTDYTQLLQNLETTQTTYKTTLFIANPTPLKRTSTNIQEHIQNVAFCLHKIMMILKPFKDNYEQQYDTFSIPKHSGGFRTINAPRQEFKAALSKTKEIFENEIKCLPHSDAYAYIKKICVKNAIEKHQNNQSNWYLKIDLHNFFPSCTPDLIYKQLIKLYPFYYLSNTAKQTLKQIIQICSLNNGLPQGTPMSPLLTNLLMVPYDYALHKLLTRGTGNHFVYTRYADDIIISSKKDFDYRNLVEKLKKKLQPFVINKEKTRYGSRTGRNWNLGLMLNKDNNITLGYRKKKLYNAMLNNFLYAYVNNTPWNKEDTQVLIGQLGYLKHIEPSYYTHLITKYNSRYNVLYSDVIKAILN